MSTRRILTKANDPRYKVPNNSDYKTTMALMLGKLKELNYSISQNFTLVNDISVSDIFKSDEQLEKEKKEAYMQLEKFRTCYLKTIYDGKTVDDPDFNDKWSNIQIFDSLTDQYFFNERFTYYKYLVEDAKYTYPLQLKDVKSTFELEDYVRNRGPVIIAQEYYGCGARCTDLSPSYPNNPEKDVRGKFGTDPEYDVYDDRITKIWCRKGIPDRIIIEEYNRSNVDASIKYKNKKTKELYNSVGSGVFDFIPGIFSYNKNWVEKTEEGEPALYTFDYKKNIDTVKSAEKKTKLTDWYINNTFESYTNITEGNAELRMNFPAEGGGKKQLILIHRGLKNYTASEGCLTIFNIGRILNDEEIIEKGDYRKFIESFLNNPEESDPMKRDPKAKVGLLFLFKDKLF